MTIQPFNHSHRFFPLTSILLALAVLLGSFVGTASASGGVKQPPIDEDDCLGLYRVRYGDTLESIAGKYRLRARDFVDVNRLRRPYTVYVGQLLCIPESINPGAADIDYPTTAQDAASFTVVRTEQGIKIQAQNFPAGVVYIVRVDDFQRGDTPRQVGRMRTGKGGSLQAAYKLPKALRQAETIQVCLKNPLSIQVACKTVKLDPR